MINQLLRLSFITFIWKRYKALIISTLLLLLFFWIVALVHQDYSQYAQLNEDKQYLGLSFLLKWLFYGLAVSGYIYYNWLAGSTKPQQPNSPSTTTKEASSRAPLDSNKNDPFEHLRNKKQLKSKADQVIDKKPPG